MSVYTQDGIESLSFDGFMIGTIRDNVDTKLEGRVKVYLPKIIYNDDGENGIWVRPLMLIDKGEKKSRNGGSYKIPSIGSKVLVIFIDNDPQKGYYFPFTPSSSGDKISNINSTSNFSDAENKVNIDTIRAYTNGNRIEFDNNENDQARFSIYYSDSKFFITYNNQIILETPYFSQKITNDLLEFLTKANNFKFGYDGSRFVGIQYNGSDLKITCGENTLVMNDNMFRLTKSDSDTTLRLESKGATIVTDGGTRVDVGNDGTVLIKSEGGQYIQLTSSGINITDGSNNIKLGDNVSISSGSNKITVNNSGITFNGNITMKEIQDLQNSITDLNNKISNLEGRIQ